MATINEVAKLAGVSKSTVSKVINGYDNLSEETIKRVTKAVVELDYVPNQSASNLSKKDYQKIGVILKLNDYEQVIDEIYMRYLLGIDAACVQAQVETSIIFSNVLEKKSTEETIAYLKSKSITSLIIIGIAKDDEMLLDLINRNVFPVVLSEAGVLNDYVSSVGIDNRKAQYEIGKQAIIENDAKRILYIAGKDNGYVSEYRLDGIKKIESEFDINIEYFRGDFSENLVYNYILQSKKQYDLIICASDLMAIGAKRALIKKGDAVNLVGFDGINLLSYVAEDILTVVQDFYKIARTCVEEALRLQKTKKPQNIIIEHTISCKTRS